MGSERGWTDIRIQSDIEGGHLAGCVRNMRYEDEEQR